MLQFKQVQTVIAYIGIRQNRLKLPGDTFEVNKKYYSKRTQMYMKVILKKLILKLCVIVNPYERAVYTHCQA